MLYMTNKTNILLSFALIATIVLSFSCKKTTEPEDIEQLKKEALQQYADMVLASYDDSYNTADVLRQQIETFLLAPSESGFEACKAAWLASRSPYGQTEAYRFYAGPIDNADGPEGLLNAWPMDESFVDYVVGNPNAGIINNPNQHQEINKQLLVGLNELFSEQSIFSGYHAAEFLLWGQDLNANGPGNRPYTDYVNGGTAANHERRGTYLKVVAELMLDHLNYVRNEWKTTGAYRNEFLTSNETKKSMGLIFSGLEEFTYDELAGERMFVAIDLKDQEHEHSCFSDNTITDIKMNLQGIRNVYFGTYTRIDGTVFSGRSFDEIAGKIDPVKAKAVRDAFTDADIKVSAIPAPFDQTIVNNPEAVMPAIEALRVLGLQLADIGRAIGAEF